MAFVDLNEAQYEAATSNSKVTQILAGPGCGKTKTLVSRICFLLENGVSPDKIICTTFTVKAAKEMRERVSTLVDNGIERKLILGTFHSICVRLLLRYGSSIALPAKWSVADSTDTKNMLQTIHGNVKKKYRSDCQKTNELLQPSAYMNMVSKFKTQRIYPEDLRLKRDVYKQRQLTIEIYEEYQQALARGNLLDFDDLLLKCVELLEQYPGCVHNVHHVLIDEFQDTNTLQYQLMKLLSCKMNCITVVGDPDQSIYEWRSADSTNLLRMKEDFPDLKVVNLEENYRSSTGIIEAANAVIVQDKKRVPKTLRSTKAHLGHMPTIRFLSDTMAEAEWVAREVKRAMYCTGHLLRPRDFAILLRTWPLSRPFEQALSRENIRYRLVGGVKFFEREEVRDILAYLKIVRSPEDNNSVLRICNVPSRNIGKTTLDKIVKYSQSNDLSLWEALHCVAAGDVPDVKKGMTKALSKLFAIIKKVQKQIVTGHITKISEMVDEILTATSYQKHLEKIHPENHEERMGNVNELKEYGDYILETLDDPDRLEAMGLAELAKDVTVTPLDVFLINLSLLSDIDRDSTSDDSLVISTIHAAKGLEWPVVFVPSVIKDQIPHYYSDNHPEERRLLYVGMTRAKALLYLTIPITKYSTKDTHANYLSQFIDGPQFRSLFAPRGPSFDCEAIASIINRETVAQDIITKWKSKLTSLLDTDSDLTTGRVHTREYYEMTVGISGGRGGRGSGYSSMYGGEDDYDFDGEEEEDTSQMFKRVKLPSRINQLSASSSMSSNSSIYRHSKPLSSRHSALVAPSFLSMQRGRVLGEANKYSYPPVPSNNSSSNSKSKGFTSALSLYRQ